MQPMSIDARQMYRYSLNSSQGVRAKGDGKPIYTMAQTSMLVFFRPSAVRVENTAAGLVWTSYVPAVCYSEIRAGDCLGTSSKRQYKVTSVKEIPMSDGQRQLELKEI